MNLIELLKTGSISLLSTQLQSTIGGKFNRKDRALAQVLNRVGFLSWLTIGKFSGSV